LAAEITIVPATLAHALDLAPRVRAADRAELMDGWGHTPAFALTEGVLRSDLAWSGFADRTLVCLFGVAPVPHAPGTGVPWLIGSDLILRHQRAFLRRNRARLAEMQALYPVLRNWVDARNHVALRWLSWLGFTIDPTAPMGPRGLPFHHFHKGV
jgi:hypothetical protein